MMMVVMIMITMMMIMMMVVMLMITMVIMMLREDLQNPNCGINPLWSRGGCPPKLFLFYQQNEVEKQDKDALGKTNEIFCYYLVSELQRVFWRC